MNNYACTCHLQPKPWSEEEMKSLVSYIRFREHSVSWPASKNSKLWESAAEFVHGCTTGTTKRTGNLHGLYVKLLIVLLDVKMFNLNMSNFCDHDVCMCTINT